MASNTSCLSLDKEKAAFIKCYVSLSLYFPSSKTTKSGKVELSREKFLQVASNNFRDEGKLFPGRDFNSFWDGKYYQRDDLQKNIIEDRNYYHNFSLSPCLFHEETFLCIRTKTFISSFRWQESFSSDSFTKIKNNENKSFR